MARTGVKVPERNRVPAHLARRFHQICLGLTAEMTEPAGLRPIEYAVLAAISDVPDIEQAQLAQRLGIDTVSTHHLLNRLVAAGHIERSVSPIDRRARALRLTAPGQALHDQLRNDMRASQQRILSPLPAGQRQAFLEMLTRLVEAHESYARPGNGRRRPPPAAGQSEARRPT